MSFLIGSSGIATGVIIYGQKVMETVGGHVIRVDFIKGFVTQFCTSFCVCFGSSLGLPLSTTHCVIGALGGIYLSGMTAATQEAYHKRQHQEHQTTTQQHNQEMETNLEDANLVTFGE